MKTFCLIMAGGGGTRFWPLSRKKNPKQFLNLSGNDTMINETIKRFSCFSNPQNLFVITNAEQHKQMVEITNGLIDERNILAEPVGRNTTACIGYSAMKIQSLYGDGIMVVTPSDAFIKDSAEFNRVIKKGIEVAKMTSDIVTIGINPTFAATGYGYINFIPSNTEEKKVVKFVEKPEQIVADEYFASGHYLWNSGIFIFRISTILKKIKTHTPDIFDCLSSIANHFNKPDEEEVLNKIYPAIRSISIDFGIMEKIDNIWVLPGDFGWNDVGSWDMLNVLHDSDKQGNVKVGNVLALDTKDSIMFSSKKLIATFGVENLIVVETDDVIMVCPKNKAQEVKQLVNKLKELGEEKYL